MNAAEQEEEKCGVCKLIRRIPEIFKNVLIIIIMIFENKGTGFKKY